MIGIAFIKNTENHIYSTLLRRRRQRHPVGDAHIMQALACEMLPSDITVVPVCIVGQNGIKAFRIAVKYVPTQHFLMMFRLLLILHADPAGT